MTSRVSIKSFTDISSKDLLYVGLLAVMLQACGESKFESSKRNANNAEITDMGAEANPSTALSCKLKLSSETVARGDSIKLDYVTTGRVTSVAIDGQPLENLDKGSVSFTIFANKTFEMTVTGGDDKATCTADVKLEEATPTPQIESESICTLTVSPDSGAAETPVSVTLAVNGVASAASINGVTTDPAGGTQEFQPRVSTVYTAVVTTADGAASCSGTYTLDGDKKPVVPPSCRLQANTNDINAGSSVVLTLFASDNTGIATIEGDVVSNGASKTVTPTATQSYTATVEGAGGTSSCSATVRVKNVAPPAAPTCAVVATPTAITTGGSSVLRFTWEGVVTSSSLAGHVVASSGHEETVRPTSSQTYSGTVIGPGGTASCEATVSVGTVTPPEAPTCTLSPAAQTIAAGAVANLSLTWSGVVTAANIDGTPVSLDNARKAVQPTSSRSYSASVTGPGGTRPCTAAVTVNPPANSSFLLSVNKAGLGSGTLSSDISGINCGSDCSESYAANTTVSLTAAASSGSSFAGWSGACTNATGACRVTMQRAQNVTATFNPIAAPVRYALVVNKVGSGSGLVTGTGISCGSDCSESYNQGQVVILTATPGAGMTIDSWAGCTSSSGNSCSVTMSASRNVTVQFKAACIPGMKTNFVTFENLAEGDFVTAAKNATFLAEFGVQFEYNNAGQSFRIARVSRQGQSVPDFIAWGTGAACVGAPHKNRLCTVGMQNQAGHRALSSTDSRDTKTIAFTLRYATPVRDLAFDLIDVDGSETWSIEPLDALGQKLQNSSIITTHKNGPAPSGNGDIITYSISRPNADIKAVRVYGNKNTKHFGFGFDNFYTGIPVCTQ